MTGKWVYLRIVGRMVKIVVSLSLFRPRAFEDLEERLATFFDLKERFFSRLDRFFISVEINLFVC